MFCYTLLYVHFSIAIILMGKRELIALLNLSSWCLVMVERLFLTVPLGCQQFVIVVFPDHTHLLFFSSRVTQSRVATVREKVLENEKFSRSGKSGNYIFSKGNLKNERSHGKVREFQNFPKKILVNRLLEILVSIICKQY